MGYDPIGMEREPKFIASCGYSAGGVKQHKDVALANPRSRELLNDIRVDAMDHLRSALAQAEEGRWEDAMVSSDIAHDRLLFADQVQVELDLYK